MLFRIGKRNIRIYKFHILIVALTILKFVLMGLFSSDYMNSLFVPFISHFITSKDNPYEYFYEMGKTNVFPYPIIMLLVNSVGISIIHFFQIDSIFLRNTLYKLPCMFFDFAGLYFLLKMFPLKKKYVVVFYFASPIILYSIYMHGQLDIIPTVLFLGALYYMSNTEKKNYVLSGGFLTAALLSKLHILAVLPIVFIYLYKKEGIPFALKYICGVLVGLMLGLAVFMSPGFVSLVLLNAEQSILTQISLEFVSVEMYIPIAAIVIIYLIAFNVNLINRDLLFSFCGVVFAVFLALCPPMPGWYVWVVPYITFFLTNVDMGKYKNGIIYLLLNGLYLIYFVSFHDRNLTDLYYLNKDMSFLKISNEIATNVLFTLLAATLLYNVYEMYQLGVASNSLYKRRNIPFTIGVAGDSGSGKSTLIGVIQRCLGSHNLLFLEGDGDHKWERGEYQWEEYTHLNPKANYLYRQATDLQQLREGVNVKRVEYDHDTGKFTTEKKIKPKKYIMLCGLHSLYLPQTRKNLDLKIYMDIDENLRRFWKIQRDVAHRGYTKIQVLHQIEERIPDAVKYIYPQKKYADVYIRYYDRELTDCLIDNYKEKLSIRLTVSAAVNLELLIEEMRQYGVNIFYDYVEEMNMQTIDILADEMMDIKVNVKESARRIIPQVDEIATELPEAEQCNEAILQLFLLLVISNKMRDEM